MNNQRVRNFALIGAAGYVAPRHMGAIKATGNRLICAFDPRDSVGVIDSFFPDAHFFTEFERFDRHVDKLRRHEKSQAVDTVAVVSPNYLHDSHIRFALRSGADAICEKPVILNQKNFEPLVEIERETGRNVYTILQLRLHPTIVDLRHRLASEVAGNKKYDVELTYITSRGRWYLQSWKGDKEKSGGIATNIGVHFFDLLGFLFGDLQTNKVHYQTQTAAGGYLEYERARVRWFLSIDRSHLPNKAISIGSSTYRSITIDNEELEFSSGFNDLHTVSYAKILNGEGFRLADSVNAISTVAEIREMAPIGLTGDYHPFLRGLI